jgi:hypothetical protein
MAAAARTINTMVNRFSALYDELNVEAMVVLAAALNPV